MVEGQLVRLVARPHPKHLLAVWLLEEDGKHIGFLPKSFAEALSADVSSGLLSSGVAVSRTLLRITIPPSKAIK